MNPNYDTLSDRQRAILDFIQTWLDEHGYPPTIREIGEAVNIKSTSVVNYNLNKLVKEGFIVRSKEVSRGIKMNSVQETPISIVSRSNDVRGIVPVALIGSIVAGNPVNVPESSAYVDEDKIMAVPQELIGGTDPSQVFALRVNGQSMIDAYIDDGDIVVLRKQHTASNGEMVAVWLMDRNETTLKHFYDDGERVRLQPANPSMSAIYVDKDQVQIQGRVLAVMRRVH
ncbi:MAG: transcriptional repressor LexA [Anaerolineae bacterium]|nr:transcriptional repressor LexA [Anaerolineae bacterium]